MVAHSSGDLIKIYFTIAYIQLIYIIIVVMKLNLIYACQLLRKRALFLWRQEDTSSLRLLSVDRSGWQMIRNFSLRHKLHLLLALLYGECDERMRQEIK